MLHALPYQEGLVNLTKGIPAIIQRLGCSDWLCYSPWQTRLICPANSEISKPEDNRNNVKVWSLMADDATQMSAARMLLDMVAQSLLVAMFLASARQPTSSPAPQPTVSPVSDTAPWTS